MSQLFDYSEFTTRNIGFVTQIQQNQLRDAKVFVCGVGGMGGACIATLARAGIGTFGLCDFDEFEVSNLNRQVFADLETVGHSKALATANKLKLINPSIVVEVFDANWMESVDEICSKYKLIVNGMDDIRAGIKLYRKAKEHGCIIIDAYSSPLPSVTVVRPTDPRPETRLNYPSIDKDPDKLTDAEVAAVFERDVLYIASNSSSMSHVNMNMASEVMRGVRKRFSFAPMVITTGNLMAYEAILCIIDPNSAVKCAGYFFNPYTKKTELPSFRIVAAVKSFFVKLFLRRLAK